MIVYIFPDLASLCHKTNNRKWEGTFTPVYYYNVTMYYVRGLVWILTWHPWHCPLWCQLTWQTCPSWSHQHCCHWSLSLLPLWWTGSQCITSYTVSQTQTTLTPHTTPPTKASPSYITSRREKMNPKKFMSYTEIQKFCLRYFTSGHLAY